jgi:hypothetical protein
MRLIRSIFLYLNRKNKCLFFLLYNKGNVKNGFFVKGVCMSISAHGSMDSFSSIYVGGSQGEDHDSQVRKSSDSVTAVTRNSLSNHQHHNRNNFVNAMPDGEVVLFHEEEGSEEVVDAAAKRWKTALDIRDPNDLNEARCFWCCGWKLFAKRREVAPDPRIRIEPNPHRAAELKSQDLPISRWRWSCYSL